MLRLPAFRYFAPRSVAEATRIAAEHGREATFVAGGTDLFPNMKRRQLEPKVLVGLRALGELRGIRGDASTGLVLGANTTLSEVSERPEIRLHYPALARAAGLVSSPAVRNMGTVGGNLCIDTRCNYYNQTYEWRRAIGFCTKKDGVICLVAPSSPDCWAVSSSDTAPVLWSLGARVRLVGPAGERVVPVSSLYRDDGIDYLSKAPDELLTEILLPPRGETRACYLKLRRRGSIDFPVLGVAVALGMEGETVRSARIVLGAVAPEPREAPGAAQILEGERLTPEVIERAAAAAAVPARPLDNTDFAHLYRKKMARVYVARALRQLAGLDPERPE